MRLLPYSNNGSKKGFTKMYKYVITFEGLKPNLTLTPTETIDPVAFVEKMDLFLFDPSKIKAIVITPFDGQKSVVGK